jgi:hypothetical protein
MKIRSIALSTVAILLLSVFVQPAHAAKTPKPITNLQDAVKRPKDVSYWAWKKSSDQVLSSTEKSGSLEILVGPNTKLTNPNPKLAFDAIKRLYPTFRHPQKTTAIYYSYKDIDWAQKKFSEIFSMASGQDAKNSCQKTTECWGASASITNDGNGVLLSAVMNGTTDPNHTTGTLEAHEYMHVIQVGSFFGTPQQGQAMVGIKAFTPWWFAEGGATFSQSAAIYANSFPKYSKERKIGSGFFFENKSKKYTEKWILNFIKPTDKKVWSDPDTAFHIYDIGALIAEIFTAIKGPGINIQIYEDISDGMTFEQSFEKHFGQSWDAAIPLIAKSISQLVKK